MTRTPILLAAVAAIVPSFAYADVTATVSSANAKPISPLIYGTNDATIPALSDRLGGNRWTAFNWENNASNAGRDFDYQNDDFLVGHLPQGPARDVPGAAVLGRLNANATAGRATILTVPINGYAAADKLGGGDVRNSGANYLQTRFNQIAPFAPNGAAGTVNFSDDFVYQDQFVNFVKNNTAPGQQVLYNLDNEPDLWAENHPEVHPNKATYAEVIQKNIDYAKAIKSVSPGAKVLGAVNYGWDGYRSLQLAPDNGGKDFQVEYLKAMKAADTEAGKRLVDALDFHYYPEARGTNGVRVTGSQTDAATVAARVQAARSLWDPTYVENSYITQNLPAGDKPIRLLPRTQGLINTHNAGMLMSLTEYNFGGGDHISGGIAQADLLGIFGEQGLYAANWWDTGTGSRFTNAAVRMYLNYDGQGGHFGDTSLGSTVSDNGLVSVHASRDSITGRVTLVVINKSDTLQTLNLSLADLGPFTGGQVFQINGDSVIQNGVVQIAGLGNVTLTNGNQFSYALSPMSVSTIALVPEPAGLALLGLAGAALLRRRRNGNA